MSEMDEAMTSERLGEMMDVNPVVLRRMLGGLRDAGIVAAEKGHGGGWSIEKDLQTVSLGDVFDAIGPANPFGIGHRDPNPRCPIERAVNRAVGEALEKAEEILRQRLCGVAVADVLKKAKRKKVS